MNRAFVVFLSLLCLFSCSNSTQAPKDLLSQDVLIAVWKDIVIAEGFIDEMRYQNQDTANSDFYILERGIFEKYEIDSAQYRTSLDYYSRDINLLDSLHQILVDTLSFRENYLKTAESTALGDTGRVRDEDAEKEALERPKRKKMAIPVPGSEEAKKKKVIALMDTTVLDPRFDRLRSAAAYLNINIEKQIKIQENKRSTK